MNSHIVGLGSAGVKGKYRGVVHGTRPVPSEILQLVDQGLSPTQALKKLQKTPGSFEDLWDTIGDGSFLNPHRYQLKHPELVAQDVESANKYTKRGINYIMYFSSIKTVSPDTVHSDITYNNKTNPFAAFFCGGPIDPTYDGDERPNWDASDGQYYLPLAPGNTTPGEGRRSTLSTDTTGPDLHRVETRYPTTDPYRELEFTFFAEATVPTYASGDITVDSTTPPADGVYLTLDDGINPPVELEFDTGGTTYYNESTGRYLIDISGSPTDADVRDAIIAAANRAAYNQPFYMVATNGGAAIVTLTHTTGGAIGHTTVTSSVALGGSWSLPTLSGGTANEAGDNGYMDNFPICRVGMAEGVDCGYSETENRVGIDSVLGLAPTFQGIGSKQYEHEFLDPQQGAVGSITALHHYTGTETITSVAQDGYVARSGATDPSGEQTAVQIDTTIGADGANQIVAATRQITLPLAVTALGSTGGFKNDVHKRKILEIQNSTLGNDGEYTIKRVVSPVTVEVYEAPNSDETGTVTGLLWETYYGKNAFDGRVLNQGRVEQVATDPDDPGEIILGEKWVSDDSAGPHVIGRVWQTAKQVTGIRIIGPAGTNKYFYPDDFVIQYLDPTANGGDPRPGTDADWLNASTLADQATNIYNGGAYGYEFTFTVPVATKGIRLASLLAYDSTRRVEIGQLMIYTDDTTSVTLVDGVNDRLRLATDGVPNYRNFDLGDFTGTVAALVDRINAVVRGYELEAVQSTFGFLWLRGTVAGGKSFVDVAAIGDSTANADLGLPSTATQVQGILQQIRKLPNDALTLMYRANISGDLPQL